MYECKTCGYKTTRNYNFKAHLNRKTPCVSVCSNSYSKSTVLNNSFRCEKCFSIFNCVKNYQDHTCTSITCLQCPTCFKVFSSSSAKYKHMKRLKCVPPPLNHGIVEAKDKEIEMLKAELNGKANVSTTINTINNRSQNIDKSTKHIQNNITYNNYNTPDMSHITPHLIANLYTHFKRDIKLLVNDVVHRVYKDVPENDCIRFIEGTKSSFVEVQHMDQKRLLPVQEVCETILTNICVLCEKHMQDCLFDGLVIGDSCSYAAQEFEQLGIDARIEHKEFRASFLPFVKSALL